MSTADPSCATCADAGRAGYCARLRCYCGHATCWASASWMPLGAVAAPAAESNNAKASRAKVRDSWNNRKGTTWIG